MDHNKNPQQNQILKSTYLCTKPSPIKTISGMAPKCKLLSLKVLDDKGTDPGRETPKGRSSNIIAAIEYIQEINGYGRRLFVHGVNMSVGYEFEPKWFAPGQRTRSCCRSDSGDIGSGQLARHRKS